MRGREGWGVRGARERGGPGVRERVKGVGGREQGSKGGSGGARRFGSKGGGDKGGRR